MRANKWRIQSQYTGPDGQDHMSRDDVLGEFARDFGSREDAEAALAEMHECWEPVDGERTYYVEECACEAEEEPAL